MVAIGTLFTGLFHLIVPEQKFGFTNSNYGDIEEEDSAEENENQPLVESYCDDYQQSHVEWVLSFCWEHHYENITTY